MWSRKSNKSLTQIQKELDGGIQAPHVYNAFVTNHDRDSEYIVIRVASSLLQLENNIFHSFYILDLEPTIVSQAVQEFLKSYKPFLSKADNWRETN